jgi:hypothetical protein
MTTFFIAPFEPANWDTARSNLEIDPKVYKQQLQEEFPETEFYEISGVHLLEWSIPSASQGARIGGALHSDRQIVSLDTPVEKFFLWHRTVIPAKHRLFLFNESSTDSLELKSGTTLEDITRFIRGPT